MHERQFDDSKSVAQPVNTTPNKLWEQSGRAFRFGVAVLIIWYVLYESLPSLKIMADDVADLAGLPTAMMTGPLETLIAISDWVVLHTPLACGLAALLMLGHLAILNFTANSRLNLALIVIETAACFLMIGMLYLWAKGCEYLVVVRALMP